MSNLSPACGTVIVYVAVWSSRCRPCTYIGVLLKDYLFSGLEMYMNDLHASANNYDATDQLRCYGFSKYDLSNIMKPMRPQLASKRRFRESNAKCKTKCK